MIEDLGKLLGLIRVGSRSKKRSLALLPIANSVFESFDSYFKENYIKDHIDIPNYLRTPRMHETELLSILHNFTTNSIKALKKVQVNERRIGLKAFEQNKIIYIWFLDTGIGLNKDLWEKAFEPFESYSEPDLELGAGTGLGLNLVRDIVRSYNGDVRFTDAPLGWKTCIEVAFPRGE